MPYLYNSSTLRILITLFIICFFIVFAIQPFKWLLISREMRLTPKSRLYSQWLKPTIPIFIQFYFFNLTNPLEFQSGKMPILKQIGPYTYHEKRSKVNVTHYLNNGTLEYHERIQYYFDKNSSIGHEMDKITSVNLGFIGIASKLSSLPLPIDFLVEIIELYNNYKLFQTRTVKELLWGYKDEFLSILSNYGINVSMTNIGILLNRNNTISDKIVIKDGVRDQKLLGKIVSFHGNKVLSYWTTPTANMINGSDGTMFHPFIHKEDEIYVFAKELCRSVQLSFYSESKVDNLPVFKYILAEDTFKSAKTYERNKGFCLNRSNCFNDGVLDMSTCQPNAPIVVSQAQLLNADEIYQNAVGGIHPTDEFNTTVYIEPNTGVIISAQSKFQVNIVVRKNQKMKQLSQLPDLSLLPLVYFNESADLRNSSIIELIKIIVKGPDIIQQILICILVIIVAILCSILLRPFVLNRRSVSGEMEQLLGSHEK
ncbi:unnamed protein product [Heterobilharzia americana]|nr:unnamed protein product [Heterobilharzia americana]